MHDSENENSPVQINKRRKLPHWSYGGSIYFVTWRLHERQKELCAEERDITGNALSHFDGQRYRLFCYVVMNDHVHVLFRSNEDEVLHKILHSWKSFWANRLQREFKRQGKIWQEEYFDRIIRNEREFYDTARYILNNPWKRWQIENYRWVWFRSPEE